MKATAIGNMSLDPVAVNVPRLFVDEAEATDAAYINLRAANDGRGRVARNFVEALWIRYHNDADENFASGIRRAFDERFWEMALACTLREHGLQVTCPKLGPDNRVVLDGRCIWIEAVCPTPGARDHPDRVPDYDFGAPVAREVPERQLILRLRSAIENKYREQRSRHIRDGRIAADAPYVVAVNGCQLPHAIADTDPPRIAKAVFPIGSLQAVFDKVTLEIVETKYAYRPSVTKANEQEVATDIFLDPAYSGLSAVLYSSLNAGNPPHVLGEDFVLLHNPGATNRLPVGFLKVGSEIQAEVHEECFVLQRTQW